jgi:hypothetical protein
VLILGKLETAQMNRQQNEALQVSLGGSNALIISADGFFFY